MAEVRQIFELDRILDAIGVQAKRTSSGEWKGHCPMHYARVGKIDRKPSWSINENSGRHNCFSCGYCGGVLDLVTDLTEMDPWSALRWLRSEGLQSLDVVYADIIEENAPAVEIKFAPTVEEKWYLFGDVPKRARVERSITKAAVEHYDIRWTDRSWVIPIMTWRGEFMGYQLKRGAFVSNEPEGMQKSDTLFGLNVFPPGETAIIVESPLDVLRLWNVGLNGVASFGVYVSDVQLELVRTFTDRVIIGLDYDIAGRQEARRLHRRLRHTTPDLRFINYRKGKRRDNGMRPKDVGEMTDEEITSAVDKAVLANEALALGLIASKEEMPNRVRRTTQGNGNSEPGRRAARTTRTGAPRKKDAQKRGTPRR